MNTSIRSLRPLLVASLLASSLSLISPASADTGSAPAASRLIDVSVRALTGPSGSAATLGFIVGNADGSAGTANLLVRGVGPTLAQFGVPDALAAPIVSAFDNGASLAVSDGWNGGNPEITAGLATAFDQAGAFSLPSMSGDIAYMSGFNTGDSYSLSLASATAASGVVLGELYDLDAASAPSSLINFSGQAQVGTGDDVLVAGFVIDGGNSMTLVIRGVGPGLGQFGLAGLLPNPQLSVYDGTGALVAQNTGWNNDSTLAASFSQVGAFALPSGSSDAAVVVTLPPGAYTAEVADANGATGQALVEVYVVQ